MDDLVRLALIYESTKTPIRRDDIAKHGKEPIKFSVAQNGSVKGLDRLIKGANKKLNSVFGMRLVPLPWVPLPTPQQLGTAAIKRREFVEAKERQADPDTKPSSYILLSTLHNRENLPVCHDQPQSLFMLLTLLVVIKLYPQAQVTYPELLSSMSALDSNISDSREHPILNLRFHSWLDKLRMQKYLVRARGMQADLPEAHDYIYALGPRACIEFPDDSMCHFILGLGLHLKESDTFSVRVKQFFSLSTSAFNAVTDNVLLSSLNSDVENSD